MRKKVFNKFSIFLIITIAVIVVSVSFHRLSIIQYTAETIVRNVLPGYVSIDKISFDIKSSRVTLKGFSIFAPPGFKQKKLIEIAEVACRYRMRGKNILDGIEIVDPVFKRPVLHIERRLDGRLNLSDMSKILSAGQGGGYGDGKPPTVAAARERVKASGAAAGRAVGASAIAGNKKVSDVIRLPESYGVRNGKIVYDDYAAAGGAHVLVFDGIEGDISLRLSNDYARVLRVGSSGQGFLNNDKGEIVKWVIDMDPVAAGLTMSNRLDFYDVQIKPFEPYYDRYSPLIFYRGRFSGTMILDFDNGNIGSTNEVHLSGIAFSVKPGAENAEFWGSTVPDLVKYFRSSSGDIVFDFKIKGEMSGPKFYFGPISKRAITAMAVDKISAALAAASQAPGQGPPQTKEEAQVRAVTDAVKLFLKKAK